MPKKNLRPILEHQFSPLMIPLGFGFIYYEMHLGNYFQSLLGPFWKKDIKRAQN